MEILGQCQCGQVSYVLTNKPLNVFAYHCKECQKLSTSPFSITAVIASEDITFQGELKQWSRKAESGNTNTAVFCADCGNRIYHFNPDDTSTVKLKLKPVDCADDILFEPQMHVWVSEKVSWYQIPSHVTCFEKQPH